MKNFVTGFLFMGFILTYGALPAISQDTLEDFGIRPAGDGAQQGPVQGGGPDQDLVVIGDPHARGGTRTGGNQGTGGGQPPGGTGGGTTGGTGTGTGTGGGTTGGGTPPPAPPPPTGPQGQTPGSEYSYTDANGVTHTNLSELDKAGLIMGGYVPVPDPKKPGAFVFVDPNSLGTTGLIGGTGGTGSGGTGTGGTGAGGTGTGGTAPPGGGTAPPPPTGGTGGTTTPPAPPTPQPGAGAGQPNTITNNGSQPVTVQVKVRDAQGNEGYELRPLGPGESMPLPSGSDYIRIFPGDLNPQPPNVDVRGGGGSRTNINEFNKKTPPPSGGQAMAPSNFGDDLAMGPGAIGGPLGSDIHAEGPEQKVEQEHHHERY